MIWYEYLTQSQIRHFVAEGKGKLLYKGQIPAPSWGLVQSKWTGKVAWTVKVPALYAGVPHKAFWPPSFLVSFSVKKGGAILGGDQWKKGALLGEN